MSQQWRQDKQPAGWLMLCLPRRNFKAWFSLTKSVEEIRSDPAWSCGSDSVSWVEMQSLPYCTMPSALTSGWSPLARLSAFIPASSLPTRLPRSPWHTALWQCVCIPMSCCTQKLTLPLLFSTVCSLNHIIAKSLLIPFFIVFSSPNHRLCFLCLCFPFVLFLLALLRWPDVHNLCHMRHVVGFTE